MLARRPLTIIGLATLPLLAAACTAMDDDLLRNLGGRSQTAEFRCDNDRRFEVSYRDGGREAVVRTGNETYSLELEDRDGDRRQYGEDDDDVQLFVEDDEARLRIKDESDYSGCEERD